MDREKLSPVEPSLWSLQPKFGPAGGPLEPKLTAEGTGRAFRVANDLGPRFTNDHVLALIELAAADEKGIETTNSSRTAQFLRDLTVTRFARSDHAFPRARAFVTDEGRLALLYFADQKSYLLRRINATRKED